MQTIKQIIFKNLSEFKYEIIDSLKREGTLISQKTKDKIEVTSSELGGSILVPLWFPVFEKGRGPRRSTKKASPIELWKIIYEWMEKRNMFKSTNINSRKWEAKHMTWYINKYGTKLFRSQTIRNIYSSKIDVFAAVIIEELSKHYITIFELQIKSELQ